MITLITGVPGSSKTLNTIKMVNEDKSLAGREIYYAGINELTLDWKEISYEQVQNWQELPSQSVVIVDEAYNAFPRRSHNKEAPEFVKALATHRHRGFDFYIITQKHTSVDHGVREHCNRHIHYERAHGLKSARRLEWPKAVDPDDYHNRNDATTSRVKFDKKYYSIYKSAEVHTFTNTLPKKVYLYAALLIGMVYLAFSIATRDRTFQESAESVVDSAYGFSPLELRNGDTQDGLTLEEYLHHWTPRVADLPYSAPAYDQVTEVSTFPRPQCYIRHSKDTCHCFTQQATQLSISDGVCRDIVENGWFNPFKDESVNQRQRNREGALHPRARVAKYSDSDYEVTRQPTVVTLPATSAHPNWTTGAASGNRSAHNERDYGQSRRRTAFEYYPDDAGI